MAWGFAFRPAAERSATTHVAATLGQIVIFWGVCLAVIPLVISAFEQRWAVALPFPVFARPLGAAMLVAASALGIAVGLILSSWLVIVYAVAGAIVWHYAIRPHEEADLERRFGADFRRYSAAVRCWVPRSPRGWRQPNMYGNPSPAAAKVRPSLPDQFGAGSGGSEPSRSPTSR